MSGHIINADRPFYVLCSSQIRAWCDICLSDQWGRSSKAKDPSIIKEKWKGLLQKYLFAV